MATNPDLQMPLCNGIDISELSIQELQDYLSAREFTATDLTQCYLKRIGLVNKYTRSVIEINPDAIEIALSLDKERVDGAAVRSPLHGIPFLVKDNIGTKDRMQTTAGSSVLSGTVVSDDAHVVGLLRAAGAILIGKANLSEWASMRSTYYSEGYSSRGGQSRNPYNLAEQVGGSSSGSAAALACNMCAFSLGTETDGSIIFPADRNGVVGFKPTVGLTSRRGVIPESPNLDSVGHFGRTIGDVAIILDIISGKDAKDEFTLPQQGPPGGSYARWVSKKAALKGARFGLPSKRVWDAAKDKVYQLEYDTLVQLVNRLREAGADIFEGTDFPNAEEIMPPKGWDWDYQSRIGHPERSEFTVVKTDFYASIKTYLSSLASNPNNIRDLEDIVSYNTNHTDKEGGVPGTHPAWASGQDSFEMSLESKGVKGDVYYKALKYIQQKSQKEGVDAALRSRGKYLDGLLVPLGAIKYAACQITAQAGYPMISIPIELDEKGIPFGIGIIQSAWNEHLLIKYGSAIEDLIKVKMTPTFLNINADNYLYVGNPSFDLKEN